MTVFKLGTRLGSLAMVSCLIAGAFPACAQAPNPFNGKPLTMIIGFGPGGGYDLWGRTVVRHIVNHLPGKPNIITQYMVGAGGLKQVDYMNKIAPRDGTVFGTIGRGLAFEPMLGKNEVGFDPLKFNWLGSMNREITVALSWNNADRKSTRLNSSHTDISRMPSSA